MIALNRLAILLPLLLSIAEAKVVVDPMPEGLPASGRYAVWAAEQSVPVYLFETLEPGRAAFHVATFSAEGPVTVRVKAVDRRLEDVVVLPERAGVKHRVVADSLEIELHGRTDLLIEFGGDRRQPLYLLVNPLQTDAPDPHEPGLHYFGPGVHEMAGRPVRGGRIYLAGGAVVRGLEIVRGDGDVKVWGRGILASDVQAKHNSRFWIGEGKGSVELRDLIQVRSLPGWANVFMGAHNVRIDGYRTLADSGIDDGISLIRVRDAVVRNVFVATRDDCIAIKNYGWDAQNGYYPAGDTRNVVVCDSTLINGEWGNGVEIGWETVGGVIEDVTFRNIDIVRSLSGGNSPQQYGAIAIHLSGDTQVRNIRYERIRVGELGPHTALIDVAIWENKYSFGRGRGSVRGLRFDDIRHDGESYIALQGADDTHAVSDVTFNSLRLGGRIITSPGQMRLYMPQFVRGVRFGHDGQAWESPAGWRVRAVSPDGRGQQILAYYAIDDDPGTRWDNDVRQQPGVAIELRVERDGRAEEVDRVEVDSPWYARARGLAAHVSDDGRTWRSVDAKIVEEGDTQRIALQTQAVRYLRLEATEPQPYDNPWFVRSLRLFRGNQRVPLDYSPLPARNIVSD